MIVLPSFSSDSHTSEILAGNCQSSDPEMYMIVLH
jgi:hypothetical protein